jgi:hypothetical protein
MALERYKAIQRPSVATEQLDDGGRFLTGIQQTHRYDPHGLKFSSFCVFGLNQKLSRIRK